MIGDPVEVVIEKVDPLRHQIDLAVIQPDLPEPTAAEAGEAEEAHDGTDDDGDDDGNLYAD
jgi:ribonuclease R